MKSSRLITAILSLVCVLAVFAVLTRQRELTNLRAEQTHVLAQLAGESAESSRPAAVTQNNVPEVTGSNPELLQLRSEITRLTQRKRELVGVQAEHDKLRADVAAHVSRPGRRLLLSSTARMAGYNTPEDTIESLLWALQHGDMTNFLQAFAPEVAQALPIQSQEVWTNAMNDFHEQFTGLSIIGRRELPDGRVELIVQLAGREEPEQPVHLKQVNGQWKLQDFK